MRVLTLALLMPCLAHAADVQVDIGIAPAALHSTSVVVGAGPTEIRFVSGVPLVAVIEATQAGEGVVDVSVVIEATSEIIAEQGLTRREQKLIASIVPTAQVLARPTLRMRTGQQAEFFAGGEARRRGELVEYGVVIHALATP